MTTRIEPSALPQPTLPIERRERRPVHMNGYALLADGSSAHVTVTDLSYDGCGIAVAAALEPGDKVQLSVLGRGAIAAEVRWCSGGAAGLVFEPMPVAEPPRQERLVERIDLRAEVTLRRSGRHNFCVTLNDVSAVGCKIEFVDRPQIDEQVSIKFVGLERIVARVCWIDGLCAGLRFITPIHPAVFDLMLERLRTD